MLKYKFHITPERGFILKRLRGETNKMETVDKNHLLNELYGIKNHVSLGNKEVVIDGIDRLIKQIKKEY